MGDSLTAVIAGVVLAAGAGTRLRPLTDVRPKALCPVGNVPLVDLAVARVAAVAGDVAVNVHHGREALEAHLQGRVHLSIEEPVALGTAGALGALRDWLAGRPALVVNADAWTPGGVESLVEGWDGERVRLLLAGDDRLRTSSRVVASLLPWAAVEPLQAEPVGLYEVCWEPWAARDALEVVTFDAPFVDCGTPGDYLAANLASSGGHSVVGDGADVQGEVVRSVVWPGTSVRAGERLVEAIRATDRVTVLVR
jgi:NDP-sugar pyrophosphorylase family protein